MFEFDNTRVLKDEFICILQNRIDLKCFFLMIQWLVIDVWWKIMSNFFSLVIQPAREAGGPEGPARWER